MDEESGVSGKREQKVSILTVGLRGPARQSVQELAQRYALRIAAYASFEDAEILEHTPGMLVVGSRAGLDHVVIDKLRERHTGLQVVVVLEDGPTEDEDSERALLVGVDGAARADDLEELELLLARRLRRSWGFVGQGLRAGPLYLDPVTGLARVGDTDVQFRPAELAILAYLAERPGHVIPRTTLMREVLRTVAEEHTVGNHVYEIRKKLESIHSGLGHLVETVRGSGYRLRVGTLIEDAAPCSA